MKVLIIDFEKLKLVSMSYIYIFKNNLKLHSK
jgi:hypothetical protein